VRVEFLHGISIEVVQFDVKDRGVRCFLRGLPHAVERFLQRMNLEVLFACNLLIFLSTKDYFKYIHTLIHASAKIKR